MASLFDSVEIGKRALNAQRLGITVTGHNLANINTPGFARQQVDFEVGAHGVPLAGVDVTAIRQIRNQLLDERLRRYEQDFARSDTQSNRLSELEALFGDLSGAGVTGTLSAFWDAWQDLTTSPESEAARLVAIERGETLAFELRRLHTELRQLREDIDSEIRGKVGQINQILESVAELNGRITSIEIDETQHANEQRDRREAQLAELSKLINIRTVESDNGSIQVLVGGIKLVDFTEAAQLEMNTAEKVVPVGQFSLLASSQGVASSIAAIPITEISVFSGTALTINSGELAGLIEVRDAHIPEVVKRFNQLATVIMEEVNALHQSGYGLDGTTGLDFFTGDDITNISVNPLLQTAPQKLAVAAAFDAEGDNQIALAIAQKRYEKLFADGAQTAEEFNNSTISLVGTFLQRAQRETENNELVVQQLTALQESVSGVSIDEELTHMIQFQRAYEAAARYVTTVDELLETLVNM